MNFINVGKENSATIDLYYEDHGTGKPVVLIHGWPLSGRSWEKQTQPLIDAGYRVITYDRRGFGYSSRPEFGYDFDSLAEDLHGLITKLDLRDLTLVGFSTGGGEVARYIGKYGTKHIANAVFISAIPPYLLQTSDNPQGIEIGVFEGIKDSLMKDRPAFIRSFLENFYNYDVLKDKLVSADVVNASWNDAEAASPRGTIECVNSWMTDFRDDLRRFDIPTLVIHSDADRIVPYQSSGKRMPEFIKNCKLVTLKGAPHGSIWTHADDVNRELLNFLGAKKETIQAAKVGVSK